MKYRTSIRRQIGFQSPFQIVICSERNVIARISSFFYYLNKSGRNIFIVPLFKVFKKCALTELNIIILYRLSCHISQYVCLWEVIGVLKMQRKRYTLPLKPHHAEVLLFKLIADSLF